MFDIGFGEIMVVLLIGGAFLRADDIRLVQSHWRSWRQMVKKWRHEWESLLHGDESEEDVVMWIRGDDGRLYPALDVKKALPANDTHPRKYDA